MNLRRLHIVMTVLVAAVTAVTAFLLAVAGYRLGVGHLRQETERQAERQMAQTLAALQAGQKPDKTPSWFVRSDGASTPFGDSPADPPLRSLFQSVSNEGATEASDTFSRGRDRYFAFVRPVGKDQALVTVEIGRAHV